MVFIRFGFRSFIFVSYFRLDFVWITHTVVAHLSCYFFFFFYSCVSFWAHRINKMYCSLTFCFFRCRYMYVYMFIICVLELNQLLAYYFLCFIIIVFILRLVSLLVCSNCWHFCWKWSTVVCCNWTYTLWFISLPHSSSVFFFLLLSLNAKSVCSNDIIIVRHHHYGISFLFFLFILESCLPFTFSSFILFFSSVFVSLCLFLFSSSTLIPILMRPFYFIHLVIVVVILSFLSLDFVFIWCVTPFCTRRRRRHRHRLCPLFVFASEGPTSGMQQTWIFCNLKSVFIFIYRFLPRLKRITIHFMTVSKVILNSMKIYAQSKAKHSTVQHSTANETWISTSIRSYCISVSV